MHNIGPSCSWDSFYTRQQQPSGSRTLSKTNLSKEQIFVIFQCLREAAKKVILLVVGPLRGGGVKAGPLSSRRGGGGELVVVWALVVGPLKSKLIFAVSIRSWNLKSTKWCNYDVTYTTRNLFD